ncbi:AAA family ATPase [Pseudarthrobacter sp. P1]|uniref:AAA family ATPase n=1 Tax=Pseudarthrobacter sp. P1 TaxID=3418418 RepID=UPI003CF3ED47
MPKVFFVIGPAGSGKSSVSQRIAAHFGAAYIDKDTATRRFTEMLLRINGSDVNERDNNEFYQQRILPLEYQTILDLARDNLLAGNDVVLDAPFGRFVADDGYIDAIAAVQGWPAAEMVVVHVRVDGEIVRQRIIARGYPRDEWKINHWEQFWAGAQSSACQWRSARHVVFDNTPDAAGRLDLDTFVAELDGVPAPLAGG